MTKQNNKRKFNHVLVTAAVFAFLLTGCGAASVESTSDTNASAEISAEVQTAQEETSEMTSSLADNADNSDHADAVTATPMSVLTTENAVFSTDISSLFTERDLRTEYEITAAISLDDVTDSVITITEEGVYELTGTLADGQIFINTEGKIQLVLNNANITCSSAPAIYIENAKKVFITTADGTENTISDGGSYSDTDESAPDAAIYSKDSLTFNGTGTLIVNGNYNDGIVSKDDLVIAGGTITVNSVGSGIKGKDSVSVYDGTVNIISGGDGLKATNDTDEGMGFIYIRDGSFNIDADEDGVQAESELIITDGDFIIKSGGGKENAAQKTNDDFGFGGMMGGRGGFNQNDISAGQTTEEDTSVSVKGIKAGSLIYTAGGSFTLDTADDAVHSNGDVYLDGGSFEIAAGDKGIHADYTAEIADGTVNITQSYEGIEASDILISGGTVYVTSSDDGFNASDGSSEGARGNAVDCTLEISGGYVYVNANGDGLDSNGSMTISGGVIIVDGPTNDGNGALDSNNGITCTGGFLIAAGSSGMAEYPDDAEQNIIVVTLDSYQEGGTLFTLCDENGSEILSCAPSKKYNSVVISTEALESGKTYTAYTGGSSTASQKDGLYEKGGYQNDGTEAGSVTMEDTVSFIGTAGGMGMGGMMGGGRGGFGGGQRPDENGDFTVPDDFDPSQMQDNFPGGQMPGDMEFPTDENGEFDPSQMQGGGRGGFGGQRPDDMEFPTDENGGFDRSQMKGRGRMNGNRPDVGENMDFGQDREQANG